MNDITINAHKGVKYEVASFGNHRYDIKNSHTIVSETVPSTSYTISCSSPKFFFYGIEDILIRLCVVQHDFFAFLLRQKRDSHYRK